jgi:tetratricopeptide (TPR) repeat protein
MTAPQDPDPSAQGESRPERPTLAPVGAPVEGMPLRRRTLPPPEWSAPRSVSGLALEWLARHAPVARRRGSRAELASLRARLSRATASGDSEGERLAASLLSRGLAARGAELDSATKLARRALMLGEDPSLREELSSWFAALGEPALAAATLKPLVDVESGDRLGRLLTRIAVFLGRHGEGRAAAEALASASRANVLDPVPDELRGAIFAWAPEALSAADGADAYLEAARRRDAQGDKAGAFEDLLRAFEIAPEHPPAAQRLSQNLAARGRAGAAEEVLRDHARVAADRGVVTHRARLREAIVDGDSLRALAAAFDAGLANGFDPRAIVQSAGSEDSALDLVTFDRLLADLGLFEIVAARLELAAEALAGDARARARIAQGRVCAGPIGNAERAVDAWIDALVSEPSSEDAKALLRQHAASTGDHGPLLEALVRVGLGEESPAWTACLRELLLLADQRLADPSLALWAVRRLLSREERDEELRAIGSRLAARARLQDESLASIRVQLAAATGPSRAPHLRAAVAALRGRPDDAEEYLAVLFELIEQVPDERAFRYALERVLARLRRPEALEGLWLRDLERRLSRPQLERARLGLASLSRARGDVTASLAVLEPLCTDGVAHRAGWAMLFALASNAGREPLRAEALKRIGSLSEPHLNALLAGIASDMLLAAGDEAGARRAAEQACHADGASPRSIAALSRATMKLRDRVAAVALERAAGVVLPRAFLCRALAETFDTLGEPAQALAWTQRGLALRPGDAALSVALLSRVTAAGDPVRIGDALAWLLSQPEPLGELVPLVCRAVCRLAEVDPPRGAALARRALDVFGPRLRELSDAVLAAADSVGERGLAIAVIERKLASGTPGTDRAGMLLDLARRRRHAGDADGAARSLVRALAEGADPAGVLGELDVALPPRGSDGDLAILQGRAEALSSLSSADLEGTARAWREFGAALWDLADDHEGAIVAWERGAALDGESGLERLASDLVAFAGHSEAVRRLEAIATRKRNRSDVARALAAAAGVALDGGLDADALAIALRALEADSTRADVLAVAERAATEKDVEQLERAYDIVARGVLGVYGERASHYRAARQLERRGFRERALRHAISAFEAVPAEGVTFVLMMRLAERTRDSTEAVQAIERVASRSRGVDERAHWLRRAALVAGSGEDGKRQRVEVLLRALEANPHGETLRSLGAALQDLVRAMPEEKEIAEVRFTRALRSMLPRLEGPDGARSAVFAAETAITTFEAPALALAALERAAEADASIDEFLTLVVAAPILAGDAARARSFTDRVLALVQAPHANFGPPLIELAEAVASAAGDVLGSARLLVFIALKEPDDVELVRRAEKAARKSGDPALLAAVLAAVPVERRVSDLVQRSASAKERGDVADAIGLLEEARAMERLPADATSDLRERLLALYRTARLPGKEEALLREALASEESVEGRVGRARDLATFLTDLERPEEAVEVVEAALALAPKNRELLVDLLNHARRTGDGKRQIEALARLTDIEQEPVKRLVLLRRLAPLLTSEGDDAGALVRHEEILALDARDAASLSALERDAERREDWEALAELLSRRARLAEHADEARVVRLRRVEVLETRLGRPQDARSELEALLVDTGDSLQVLTRLADLNERLGARLRAAPLWLRASTIPKERAEAGELARRACQAYLDGGDVESARRVFGEMAEYPRTAKLVALRVDIERRSENPRALSEALEEMALSSMEPPKARATVLVEAARAALAAGHLSMALGQAQRASRIARDAAEPQLFARLLEYRQRGTGTREEATTTLFELRAIRDTLGPEQRELSAFLLAEALDVANGEGEGMRELSRVHAEIGPLPLVALGMAERLVRGGEPERALPLFDVALEGDLRELRRRGEVALVAAEAATAARLHERALEYLEIAAAMPDTRALALGAQTELRKALGRISEPPLHEAPPERAPSSDRGSEPPEAPGLGETILAAVEEPSSPRREPVIELTSRRPQELGREPVIELRRPADQPIELTVRSTRPVSPESPPSSAVARGSLRASAPPKPTSRRPSTLPSSPAPPAAGSPRPPVQRASERLPSDAPSIFRLADPPNPAASAAAALQAPGRGAWTEPPGGSGAVTLSRELESSPLSSTTVVRPEEHAAAAHADGQRRSTRPPGGAANEEALLSALARGSIDAGTELMLQLENRSDRSHDLVTVCRRVAHLLPGDRAVLHKLYEATLADRNIVYARAVEHVIRAFDPKAAPLDPPPIGDQVEQPDRVHAVLFRDTACAATEALGLVWNGAQHLFRRDPSSYGVTGLERVAPNSPTPIARLFGAATRVLGLTRTPLFQRKSGGPVSINVALLSPPALVLTGEVRGESASLGYHLGAMLGATLPEQVLLYGAPQAQVENVLRALMAAFGPPQAGRGHLAAVATLAEMLWESMPARSQRRLRELCDDPARIDYEEARLTARQAVHRSGLFISGDLTVAIREACSDLGISTWGLDAPGGLAALCSSSPAVADLVRLATSPEYASTRWQQARAGVRHPSGAWSTV